MQHTLCVAPVQSSANAITVKLFKLKWWVTVERLPWGQRKGDAASSSSPPALSPWVALLTGLRLTLRLVSAGTHCLLFSLGPAIEERVGGLFPPQRSKFSGKYSPYLPLSSSSHQILTWLLCPGHKTPWTTPN